MEAANLNPAFADRPGNADQAPAVLEQIAANTATDLEGIITQLLEVIDDIIETRNAAGSDGEAGNMEGTQATTAEENEAIEQLSDTLNEVVGNLEQGGEIDSADVEALAEDLEEIPDWLYFETEFVAIVLEMAEIFRDLADHVSPERPLRADPYGGMAQMLMT